MGNILIGNIEIQGAWVGNADVSAIWLGNVLVWPTNWYDCNDKLLVEREFGIKGNLPNKTGEYIIRIDRKTYENLRDYDNIITEQTLDSFKYEGPNKFPYDVDIARDYINPHPDTEYSLVTADTLIGEIAFDFEDPIKHSFTAYIGHDSLPLGELPYVTSDGKKAVNEQETSYIITETKVPI